MDMNTYTRACLELARSVRIYHSTVAKQVLNYYQLNRLGWEGCSTAEDHPYVRHLRGLAAHTDLPVSMVSIDTGVQFTLSTNLSVHPKTRQRLQVDHDYFLQVAMTLGEFGYARLTGFLYPYTGEVPLKNGTILGYDATLVEENEYSLMSDLQQWIYRSLIRWTNSGYIASDELYGAAIHGILYAHMPSQIVNLRDLRVQTQEVHPFHVDHYLADHTFANVIPFLSVVQKYSLYKHIPWLLEHRGTDKVFKYYKQLLEMDHTVSVSEYSTRVDPTEVHVSVVKTEFNQTLDVNMDELSLITTQSRDRLYQALAHGEVVDNLPQITVQVRGNHGLFIPLKKTMLYSWGYYADINVYVDTLQVEMPDGSTRPLSTKDAFKYYIIHRPMSTFTQGYNSDAFILPSIQDISGNTGQDLFNFVDISRIDRQLFTVHIEQMYFDKLRLRTAIPLTPVSERVYWEGEFPRTYQTMAVLIPDKQTWLTEHNLPELTDEYLDKLFEVFTGYSLTEEAKTIGKASAYRTMLYNVLSNTVHLTNEMTFTVTVPFIHVPPVGVLTVTQLPI